MARKALKSHCYRGHLLSGDNVYYYPNGKRACRACINIATRNYKQRHPDYLGTMSVEVAEIVIAALGSGKTLREICNGRHRITYYERFRTYCAAHPEYARRANALAQRNAAAAQKRKGHNAKRTRCKNGHSLTDPANVRLHFNRGYSRRTCLTCERLCEARPMIAGEVKRVAAAVKSGFKIDDITRSAPGLPRIVGFKKLRRHRVDHPEFDRFLIENMNNANSRSKLLHCRIVPENARWQFAVPAILKPARKDIPPFLMRDEDVPWVLSLIPRAVPDQSRYDVLQDVFLVLSAREISRDQVAEWIRKRSAKYVLRQSNGRDPRDPWSLDAPAYLEGTITRGDTISRGLWD